MVGLKNFGTYIQMKMYWIQVTVFFFVYLKTKRNSLILDVTYKFT